MSTDTATALWLSDLELDVLWNTGNYGTLPYPLEVTWHGVTGSERRVLERRAYDVLVRRGLVESTRRGLRPVAPTEDMFAVLARPRIIVDAFLGLGELVRAAVATVGQVAVLAVQSGGRTTFTWVRPDVIAGELIALLPPHRGAHGHPVSVPSGVLGEASAGDPGQFEESLVAAGVTATQARTLLLSADGAVRSGQFGVNLVDRVHGRKRLGRVVSWFDTDAGRFLVSDRQGHDGRRWTTVVGADRSRLLAAVAELITEADQQR